MAEQTQDAAAPKTEVDEKVRPTLFIGLGGTGMEVLMRIRHKILVSTWGSSATPVRISNLSEFPVAEFMRFDLDAEGVQTASNQANQTDIFAQQKEMTENEKIVHALETNKYFQTSSSLDSYPQIQKWLPLTRSKFIELKIDPAKGAGQIRALSRLYFYDKYRAVREMIGNKLGRLSTGVTNEAALNRLGLEMENKLRIVIVTSSAGGTGSGSFLDMGYLAKILGEESVRKATVELFMVLPGGYGGFGKSRTEANGYGSLMELETLMSQDVKYVENWERNIPVNQPLRPFDNVYLFDTTNLVGESTANVSDLYDMMAESLFEEFQSEAFGKRKRSIAANTSQHKAGGFTPPSSLEYKDLDLSYSNTTSALGQFTIDTHLEQNRNMVVAQRVNTMLESFFGIGLERIDANKPTEAERDLLMNDRMYLSQKMFTLKYEYAGKAEPRFEQEVEKSLPLIVDELLRDLSGRSLVDEVTAKIHGEVEQIKSAGDRDQWSVQVADLKRQLERDAFRKVETGTGMREEVISQRRAQVLAELTNGDSGLVKALWDMVDNNERGGINYTRELIESVKDKIENAETGLLGKLMDRAKWFDDLSGKINADEIRVLESHLSELRGSGFPGLGNSRQQRAETKLGQLAEAMALWIVAHLQAVACREAHTLLTELSAWLGEKTGYDPKTDEEQWRGFIGTLMQGRKQVQQVMAAMTREIAATRESMKTEHATYVVIPAPQNVLTVLGKETGTAEAKTWAMETFSKYGGKRELFLRLGTKEGSAELISELRNMALRKLPEDVLNPRENPLFEALRKRTDREALFKKCLRRAMPWVNADFGGVFMAHYDQYSCVIGVGNAKQFDEEFGAEFRRAAPSDAGFSSNKIAFEETGIPGKLTCYIEFSGLPLTTLRQLPNWRASYDLENKKIPVNTSNKKSAFVHPLHPSHEEVRLMEADFRNFLHAVAIGVLHRRNAEDGYEIRRKGNRLAIGVERLIRLEGISPDFREEVQTQINSHLDKARSAVQLCALSVLFENYTERAYKSRVEKRDEKERIVSGLGHFVCSKLQNEYAAKFKVRAGTEALDDAESLPEKLQRRMNEWTSVIDGSEEDGYRHEVAADAGEKRVGRPEFFDAGWLEQLMGIQGEQVAQPPGGGGGTLLLPPPEAARSYYVLLNGVPVGPIGSGELRTKIVTQSINAQTLVCPLGGQQWVAAGSVAELAALFIAPPPLPPGAMAPPPLPPMIAPPFVEVSALINGQQSGPFDAAALRQMVAAGQIRHDTLVWRAGMATWQPMAAVADLASMLTLPITPPPAPAQL